MLALSKSYQGSCSSPPPKCNAVEKKNLGLLNHIALLLVAKTRGDIAAVTMEISSWAINFYYAKMGRVIPQHRFMWTEF